MDRFVVGAEWFFDGPVHEYSYGDGMKGIALSHYDVRILWRIEGRRYPILLGDASNYKQLGWVSEDELCLYGKYNGAYLNVCNIC